jgi:GH15 family glucan-1,4-alpha-glucosidase
MSGKDGYPPIGDYGFIANSNAVALVSRSGSVDWCCMERIDSGSCFGRLLDWEKGGYCSISPRDDAPASARQYVDGTLRTGPSSGPRRRWSSSRPAPEA